MHSKMTYEQTQELLQALIHLPRYGWIEVDLESCSFTVQKRPPYCDRGSYTWLCDSKDQRVLTIEEADGFPRYYFHVASLTMEMEAWCKVRGQEVLAIELVPGFVS